MSNSTEHRDNTKIDCHADSVTWCASVDVAVLGDERVAVERVLDVQRDCGGVGIVADLDLVQNVAYSDQHRDVDTALVT